MLSRAPGPEPDPQEDGIELLLDLLDGNVLANLNAAPEFDAQALNEFHLLKAYLRQHLVVGDAVGVEPTGLRLLLEDHDLVAELRQLGCAAKPGRPAANDRHALAGLPGRRLQEPAARSGTRGRWHSAAGGRSSPGRLRGRAPRRRPRTGPRSGTRARNWRRGYWR